MCIRDSLVEDYNIRKFLKNKLYAAGISKIETERASDRLKIVIHTAKPGIVIGKGGAEIENLKKQVEKLTSAKKLSIDIKEVKRPDKDAQLVAENIAQQLENRISFRRAMKSCMGRTMTVSYTHLVLTSSRLNASRTTILLSATFDDNAERRAILFSFLFILNE